jgi:hypothetical protein
MAMNILPFEGKALPAYLKNVNREALNDELVSSGAGFPVISIKGKTFAIVRGGEREILPNPKDPDSPATSIDVVILKANKGVSKIYYPKRYEEGDDSKPTCYSLDGITPEADAPELQSPKCATCRHNEWGSRITEAGKKGKACQDGKRLAVTTPDQLNEPYLIRVPPASLAPLTEYAQFLAKRGVKYNMVVTKITFDADAATPKLMFKAVGLLDENSYAQVQEALKMDVVDMIVGAIKGANGFEEAPAPAVAAPAAATPAAATPAAAPAAPAPVKPEAAAAAAQKAIATAAQGKPAPKFVAPTPAPAPVAAAAPAVQVAEPEIEVDLDNLSFDD